MHLTVETFVILANIIVVHNTNNGDRFDTVHIVGADKDGTVLQFAHLKSRTAHKHMTLSERQMR